MSLASRPFKINETSPAAASTVASTKFAAGLSAFDNLFIAATITGATGGTLDVYLIDSFDDGATWFELARFTQAAAGAAAVTYVIDLSLTNAVTRVARSTTATSAIGVLSANSARPGKWGDMIKAVYVAGGGTSVGAAQVIEFFASNSRR